MTSKKKALQGFLTGVALLASVPAIAMEGDAMGGDAPEVQTRSMHQQAVRKVSVARKRGKRTKRPQRAQRSTLLQAGFKQNFKLSPVKAKTAREANERFQDEMRVNQASEQQSQNELELENWFREESADAPNLTLEHRLLSKIARRQENGS